MKAMVVYILNPSLVQELALNKLQVLAEQVANNEGWSWYGSQERLEVGVMIQSVMNSRDHSLKIMPLLQNSRIS
jgi:hypothetical protein